MPELAEEIRDRTRRRLAKMGFPEPPVHLPLAADAESPFELRSAAEVIERLLALNVRVNLAFGMPATEAQTWLATNDLLRCLSAKEEILLAGAAKVDEEEQTHVEALWGLAWALSLVDELEPGKYCGDELVTLLPDLRVMESSATWVARSSPHLRSSAEVMRELDLLYAMTWGVTDARLSGAQRPGTVAEYVHWQRRRALEFTVADPDIDHSSWDDIDLST
jgi:hypothetical protein